MKNNKSTPLADPTLTVKVRAIEPFHHEGKCLKPGEETELSPAVAAHWIREGKVEEVKP
ncbi:MAG TPA: hypothetical protein VNO50_10950 [Pyrinomonadaceae bacterium]|nr:hypothetical protein [Pyrinomonadaceae bacterium]